MGLNTPEDNQDEASALLNTAALLLQLLPAATSSAVGQSGCKVIW